MWLLSSSLSRSGWIFSQAKLKMEEEEAGFEMSQMCAVIVKFPGTFPPLPLFLANQPYNEIILWPGAIFWVVVLDRRIFAISFQLWP